MSLQFSEPQEYILTSTQKINLFLAGVGSGKTFIIGTKSGYLIENFPDTFGFIGANTYMQLSQSTLFRVRTVWKEIWGWEEGVDYVMDKKPPRGFNTSKHEFKSYTGICSFRSGAVVFLGSLDNAKAHDGKEFGWAFLDETKDSREDDVKDIILARLRMPGIYIDAITNQLTTEEFNDELDENIAFLPLYILTSPAKVDWLNEWFDLPLWQEEIAALIYNQDEFFVKEVGNKCVVISSTFHNRDNLPPGYTEGLLEDYSTDKANMLIYGNPFVKTGGEFYSEFDRLKIVKKVEFNPELPVHISLDQNVVPYITMTLYQVDFKDNGDIVIGQFDEICLPNPKNKTSKLCLEFIKRYGYRIKSGLFYYGDPSGKNSDTRGEHDYAILKKYLKRYLNNRSNRVPYKHPSVLKRKDFSNDIFGGKYKHIEVRIDPRCKHSIADFEHLKEDGNGKKDKRKITDPVTGQKYEKYGHTSDTWDYFVTELLKALFKRDYK